MVGLDNPIHLVLLLTIVLLVFGAKRLPEMGRSLGSGLRGFKQSINGEDSHERSGELAMVSSDSSADHAAEAGAVSGGQSTPRTAA